LKGKDNILNSCLQGKGPDDTGDTSEDQLLTNNPSVDDGTEYVKRGCSNITVNDPQGDE
jgi:hypothetical protein